MSESLLQDLRVVDAGGEPAHLGGRILADLGAAVVKLEPRGGDPLRVVGPFAEGRASLRFAAWNAGKTSVAVEGARDPRAAALLAAADVVIDTPGWPGALALETDSAPRAVWVRVTPFGLRGPRAGWRASDLGIVAASGNLHATGYPDRPPLRCTEPAAYAHAGPEIAIAVLAGIAAGGPQVVDLSLQETCLVANMGAVGDQCRVRDTRTRRAGATLLGMQEIWGCKDGWLSFGLRGGVARVRTYQHMTGVLEAEGLSTPAWSERDWTTFNHHLLSDEERRAIEEPLARYFERHTLSELYALAAGSNLLLATCNTPRELYQSQQLEARGVFEALDGLPGFPVRFAHVRSADGNAEPMGARRGAPVLDAGPAPAWTPRALGETIPRLPFEGTTIVEFGAGAAGPIASRYFAEHGACVIRVESRSRPEFLRTMAVAAKSPHGLEGDPIFNALNPGKQSITLNLKHPDGLAVAKRLAFHADLVLENFSPKAMPAFGLDYDTLSAEKPDLVMVSSCMNGQTGPHKSYPGFGSQGSALAGFTHLTAFPDRPPVGPFGTITDSLAPRFVAASMAAALHYRRRTGRGLYVDVAQVEAASYTLGAWLLDFRVNGRIGPSLGNRSLRAAPHGVFPCRGDDAWIAIAIASDAEWQRFADLSGITADAFATEAGRRAQEDTLEARISAWTRDQVALECAQRLQAAGLEGVPVQSFPEVYDDPQLAARGHLAWREHTAFGRFAYERNGFRLGDPGRGYAGPAPALGEHTHQILADLGYTADEIARLKARGGVE